MGPRSSKAKAPAVNVKVPQNKEEAAAMIAEFGVVQRMLELDALAMKEALATIKRDAEAAAAPHIATLENLFKGLQLYCAANRETLTEGGKTKTVDFGTGRASWRLTNSKVTLSGEHDDIIARILTKAQENIERGLDGRDYLNFLRTKQEIDKEAMLKLPDLARTVEGVKIGRSGETFEIEPFSPDLAEAS